MTDPVEGSRLDAVKRSDAPAERASDRLDTRLPRARQVRNAVVRLPAQAQQAVSEVVRMLAAVVGRLRTPLLVAVLLPVAAGVLLVAVSAIRGGADLPIACVLAVVGVVPSIWLAVRRAQLLRALQPPDEAGAEIYAALDVPAVWAQFKENLTQVAVQRNKSTCVHWPGRSGAASGSATNCGTGWGTRIGWRRSCRAGCADWCS